MPEGITEEQSTFEAELSNGAVIQVGLPDGVRSGDTLIVKLDRSSISIDVGQEAKNAAENNSSASEVA